MNLTNIAGFEHRDANATKPAAEHISHRYDYGVMRRPIARL